VTAPIQICLLCSKPDEESVNELYRKLSNAGFKPCLDTRDILPEEKHEPVIQRAVRYSDILLLCHSADSVFDRARTYATAEDYLSIEWEEASKTTYTILVRLDNSEIPKCLADLQSVNLFEDDGWARLTEVIIGVAGQDKEMAEQVNSDGRLTRILIADDDEFVAKGMKLALDGADLPRELSVEIEYELIETVAQRIQSGDFDVLILDIDWYGDQEAGLHAIQSLKVKTPDLRVVAISGYAHLVSKARVAGADIARRKGFNSEELIRLVELATQLPPKQMGILNGNEVASEERLEALRRRLRILQLQEAKLGLYVPSYISMEIEDTQESIRDLMQRLYGEEVE
jgi:DNA-binding NarL/FixJ family response regulator